jgi:hypothetical protein
MSMSAERKAAGQAHARILARDTQRRGLLQGSVRPVGVIEVLVLAQHGHQVPLVPDQGPVEQLAAAAADPVGLEYAIVALTCFFSQQGGAVRRRSGTRA